MALIKCPECSRYMSAKEPRCIYCERAIPERNLPIIEGKKYTPPKPTVIEPMRKDVFGRILWTAMGLMLIVLGFVMLHVFSLGGIILFIGGGFLLSKANSAVAGSHRIFCPHCKSPGVLSPSSRNYQCPSCHKDSVKDGDFLKPVK